MVSGIKSKSVLSERVAKEKEELLSATPMFDVGRIRCLLEAYAETEGQPPLLRRARYFEKRCLESEIYIDGNPFVGTLTPYKYGGSLYLEAGDGGCSWMKKAEAIGLQRGRAIRLDDEQREWVHKAADYWQDRNVYTRTRQILLETLGVDADDLRRCGIVTQLTPGSPAHPPCDFSRVLNMGLNGIIAEVETEKRRLDIGSYEDLNKWYFHSAASTCLKAMKAFAQRYASLAREMAEKEPEHQRKWELRRIAETCQRVPAEVPRNFFEALQSLWFSILGIWMELPNRLIAEPMRFSQYMYPFYLKDKKEGKITDEEVIELIQFFFLKLNGLASGLSPDGRQFSGSRLGLQLTIGGLTPDGEDATNELDWLILEAQERVQLPEPLVALMYHNKLSQDFLLKCVSLIRTGVGQPAFHNLDVAIKRHLYHHHMSVEETRNLAVWGCVQSALPGHMYGTWEGYLNLAKMVELVLNNGKDPLTGTQIGPQTGDIECFESYEQVYSAVLEQIRYFIPILRYGGRLAFNIARDLPLPFTSITATHDCVKSGIDETAGGTKYAMGGALGFVAAIDLTNSLAAIRKLVFAEKRFTLQVLKAAFAANFVGYDEIYRDCLAAPKYGNDDDSVDIIAKEIYRFCWEEHQKTGPDFAGNPAHPDAYSVIGHVALGRLTGALPSGRKAGVALTDASVSAQPGTDRNGPTALAKSAARVVDTIKWGSSHFNMKFHPSALEGMDNARKILSMIETYFDLGGYHVQFNCVKGETLRDAQCHPENYRDLIVRVAGYSAYFASLDKETQDEIIKRTDLRWN